MWGNYNNHHHHHGHHHGHHNNHGHHEKEVIVVVEKTNSSPQYQGFNTGFNQGFNAGQNQGLNNYNQGFNNHGASNKTGPLQMSLFNPNVDYIITSCNNDDYALDVSQDPLTKGTLLIWKKDKNKRNQLFRIVLQNGWYNIFSISDMNVVSVSSNQNTNGDSLSSLQNVGAQGQCWKFKFCSDKKDDNQFFIHNGF